MEENIKQLTWKYFWQQKWAEISFVLLIMFISISIVGVFSQFGWFCKNIDPSCTNWGSSVECVCKVPYEPSLPRWMMYSGWVTTSIWIIIGLVYWLKLNWKKAKERAEQEVKHATNKKRART